MSLPAGHRVRATTLDDLASLAELVHAADLAVLGFTLSAGTELRDALTRPGFDLDHGSWVVHDPSDRLVGWGWAQLRPGYVGVEGDVYVHPQAAGTLYTALLHLVVERAGALVAGGRATPLVTLGVLVGDEPYAAALTAAGFAPARRYARMRRDLRGDERPPAAPTGVRVRIIDPDDDGEGGDLRTVHRLRTQSFAGHYGSTPEPYDTWRERVAAETDPRWQECFLAEVNGEPVAVLQSSGEALEDGGGWVRALGVLPGHRRSGLGRLLLETSFAAYTSAGLSWAGLGVDTANVTNALHLYESVGMRPIYLADAWQRPLP